MISSVLIANRGEIARRIIRTAKRMGVRTVAVYSDADAQAVFVREADEAIAIGPAPAAESYLKGEAILAAAKASAAEAIHPGYGFLSENAAFAEAVIKAGLVWVGPKPESIRAMGLKDAAKSLMEKAGVPVTPGYLGEDQSEARLAKEAKAVGYPVLIKAVAGGGGKGMRKVDAAKGFADALSSCRREASASFGDDRVLIEKYVERPRHIEVQVFGDAHGNVVHLFERDCSLQRRHQKVIEEAPAPGMDAETRAAVCAAAVKAAQAVNYEGAGTIEFIADASEGLRADRIWFMEMNTRLQVEHPVTEMITGLDLVEWQLRVASGQRLPRAQDEITMFGHAMEARLYAEDASRNFMPSTGRLKAFELPEEDGAGLRIDAAVEEGGEITPFYDPMIAKVIVHAQSRDAACENLAEACGRVVSWPVRTNAGFLVRCLRNPRFQAGDVDTGLIEQVGDSLTRKPEPSAATLGRAAQAFVVASFGRGGGAGHSAPTSPWAKATGFRLNRGEVEPLVRMTWDKEPVVGDPRRASRGDVGRKIAGEPVVLVGESGETYVFELDIGEMPDSESAAGDGAIRAPMPGRVTSAEVKDGAKVAKGDVLLVLEAMKMEHALKAPIDGVISGMSVGAGDQVEEGVVLLQVIPEGEE